MTPDFSRAHRSRRAASTLVVGALVLFAGGCARGALSNDERTAIAKEIERRVKTAYDLSKPGVEQRMLALYADTGRIISASAGQIVMSRDTLRDDIHYFWQNVGANMRGPTWIWDQMLFDVIDRDAAVMTASYHIPHHTPAGMPHVIGGAWTALFRRESGKWVIVQEHLSDLPTPLAMAMAGVPVDSMAAMPRMSATPRDSAKTSPKH